MFVGGVPVAALAAKRIVSMPAAPLDIDLTQGAGGLTCSRNSIGTAIDASGNVVSFAANALRRTSAGLLVEVARTNSLLQSQALATSPWTTIEATLANNSATAPDGTATAASLTETTANNAHQASQALGSNVTGFASVFVKPGLRTWFWIQINSSGNGSASTTAFNLSGTGIVGTTYTLVGSQVITAASIFAIGNGWYLLKVAFTGGASLFLNPGTNGSTRSYAGSTASPAASIWGAQIEAAASGAASSYIPTTTATVARAADTVTLPQSGIGRVVLTFDDGSQQTIGGIPTGTPYSLVPANLNRPLIRRLQGFAA